MKQAITNVINPKLGNLQLFESVKATNVGEINLSLFIPKYNNGIAHAINFQDSLKYSLIIFYLNPKIKSLLN